MKRTKSLIALTLAMLLLFAACGGTGSGDSTTAPADQGGQSDSTAGTQPSGGDSGRNDIKVTLNSEPESLHAGFATSVVSTLVGTQFFDTLVIRNDATNDYEPSLATSWTYNEDSTAITFELRDDVTFHNGEKMTAEDVIFSFHAVIAGGYSNVLTSFMDNMEKIDDTHVRLNFKFPYGPALECIAQSSLGIFPQAAYEADPDGFGRNPVGSGPYKFVQWKTGASITMEAFEDYFMGAPAIKNAEFVIYNNTASSAALALENGELDVLTTVASTDNARLSANDKLLFDSTAGSVVTFIMFSMIDPANPFNDENLRLAVAHAIDKEAVMIGATEGQGFPATALVPSYCFGLDPDYQPPQYDPDKAIAYLEAAGYPNGIDITVPCSANDLYYKPMEIIQAQLAEVGIRVTVDKMDNNAWFEDVFRIGAYPFQVVSFSSSVADVDYYYEMFTSTGNENFGGVNVPEVDAAYMASRSIIEPDARTGAIRELQRVMGDKAVIIPVYQNNKTIAANKDLKGVVADSEGIYRISDWSW